MLVATSFIPTYRIILAGGHPEGPNIGYNSNSSWFDNKQTDDNDNMQSHAKGDKKFLWYLHAISHLTFKRDIS